MPEPLALRKLCFTCSTASSRPLARTQATRTFHSAITCWALAPLGTPTPHAHPHTASHRTAAVAAGDATPTPVPHLHVRRRCSVVYVAGVAPSARKGHGLVAIGGSLYVWGGCASHCADVDMYVLDTSEHKWERRKLSSGAPPAARAGHAMVRDAQRRR